MDTLNFKLDSLDANATSRLHEGNEDGNLAREGNGAGGKKADKLLKKLSPMKDDELSDGESETGPKSTVHKCLAFLHL